MRRILIVMAKDDADWVYSIKSLDPKKDNLILFGSKAELRDKAIDNLNEKEKKGLMVKCVSIGNGYTDESLSSEIQDVLKEYIPDKPNIYFVGHSLEESEKKLKKYLADRSCGVAYNKTLSVGKTSIYRTNGQASFAEDVNDFDSIDMITVEESKEEKNSKGTTPVSRQESSDKQSKQTDNSKTKRNESQNENANLGKEECLPGTDDSLNRIEENVFESEKHDDEIRKMTHSAVQNAKAALAYQIQIRLHKHILRKLGKEGKGLTDEDLFQLVLILLKTDALEDFKLSWKTIKPFVDLSIKEEDYNNLKEEAGYYSRLTDMLYEEDKWKR